MKFTLHQPIAFQEFGARQNQEDSIFPSPELVNTDSRLFILCDGMGGHEHGEVASQAVCEAMSEYLNTHWSPNEQLTDDIFLGALEAAYELLDSRDTGGYKKMGTTLVFICFHRGGVFAAHIGDSRYYHLRPNAHKLVYRSRDHSLVNQLYELGDLTKPQMHEYPKKNVLLRAMQPGADDRCRAEIVHIRDIRPGDVFYLCSDGMLEQTTDAKITDLFTNLSSYPDALKAQLIKDTDKNHDNHSAIIIKVASVITEENDTTYPDDEQRAYERHKFLSDPDPEIGTPEDLAKPAPNDILMAQQTNPDSEPIPSDTPIIRNSTPALPPSDEPKSFFETIRPYIIPLIVLLGIAIGVVAYKVGLSQAPKKPSTPETTTETEAHEAPKTSKTPEQSMGTKAPKPQEDSTTPKKAEGSTTTTTNEAPSTSSGDIEEHTSTENEEITNEEGPAEGDQGSSAKEAKQTAFSIFTDIFKTKTTTNKES